MLMLHRYAVRYAGMLWVTGVTHLYEALTPAYTRPTATRPLISVVDVLSAAIYAAYAGA